MAGFVRFSSGVEQIEPDEQDTFNKIVASMTRESGTVAKRMDGHMVRASHAKSTGLLTGELRVLDGLAPELRQGLFAEGGSYPALVRLAQGPGEILSDSVSTHRGMSVKLLGVAGPKLPGHDADTQDFVFATGTAFAQSNASTFLQAMRGLEAGTPMPELVKQAVSTVSRAANAVVQAAGGDSPMLGFFGHTKRNPLADAYFSQAPLRYGEYIAKLGFFPVSPGLLAMVDQTLDTGADPDAFRHAVVEWFRREDAEFELRVQLCTDLVRMPVEDADMAWPEDESPYRPVARLLLPRQDAYSPARRAFYDELLSFRPAHSLAAHQPLGSIMRARLKVYGALQEVRHRQNRQVPLEPRTLAEVPD